MNDMPLGLESCDEPRQHSFRLARSMKDPGQQKRALA